MASTTPNTVVLKGCGIRKEGVAAGTITPGHLVKVTVSGVAVHSTAGGQARKAFAVENDLIGNGISDNYSANDTVQFNVFSSGEEVYAFVKANAAAIVIGDALESAGNGTLQKYGTATDSGDTNDIVGYALEAVDNSGGGTAARIRIEVA